MKHLINILSAIFLLGLAGCDFLDVVPNDAATLDHAFSNRSVTEKFMRTCYSHLPDPTDPFYYPAYYTSRDEFGLDRDNRARNSVAARIADGLQNTNDPYQNYWSGQQGGNNLYVAIRDCNIFLNNIHIPRDMDEAERSRWRAEVIFLKAYYHFFLMKLYGPIVIADEEVPLATSPQDLLVYREPIDVCVDYIVGLLDEAIKVLPPVLPDMNTELGRISQTIALSVKAKVLAWAASPLFNGNPDYRNWIDNRGLQLIPETHDQAKWQKAAEAIKEAIDVCHENGLQLYTFNKYSTPQSFNMNDSVVQLMTIRKAITEDIERNTGMIWATQEACGVGKGGSAALGYNILGDFLRNLFPYLYAEDQPSYVNYANASWNMVELFYSNNGVPIEEDRYYNYSGRFNVRRATPGDNHQSYIATGETTVELHFNREPRFYANLGFDRGFYELSTTTADYGASFSPFAKWRAGEVFATGTYVPKKIIPFESSCSQGDINKRYAPYDYRFPLIRLADLYLLYCEALNEVKDQPDAEVYYWIDLIREHAGLDGVVDSWANAASNPEKPLTKTGMRDIIQKERLIELAFEGQRFWDVRRWKIADQYWTLTPTRWTVTGVSAEEFYIPETVREPRKVTFKDYLFPLRNYDLRVNPNLVQTYGW